MAAALPKDDGPAKVARAGVRKARRRLVEIEAAGLFGEVARVKRLARSVVSLCDHYDTLSGVRMCLVCDKPIEGGDPWEPYGQVSPSGGATWSGRVAQGLRQHSAPSLTSARP
ncbi:DUF6415 family natural product biosynthesis protein [Streptomyces sp. NPDC004561]